MGRERRGYRNNGPTKPYGLPKDEHLNLVDNTKFCRQNITFPRLKHARAYNANSILLAVSRTPLFLAPCSRRNGRRLPEDTRQLVNIISTHPYPPGRDAIIIVYYYNNTKLKSAPRVRAGKIY